MSIDLSQPAPRARTLEEAQALIDELWSGLRAQAQQIEGRIEELTRQIQERDRQIAALTARLQTLEERLHTNSRNSSTPPSTDPHRPPAKKPPSGKKPGAQPGIPAKPKHLFRPAQAPPAPDSLPGASPPAA